MQRGESTRADEVAGQHAATSRGAPRPAVFLDRDGTINVDVGYLRDPDALELIPGTAQAIARFNAAGLLVIVVTNQSGVARGMFDEQTVHRVHARLDELLARERAHIDAYYFCPFHPAGQGEYRLASSWRKPNTGMLEQASGDFAIDFGRSWMVGDKPSDIEFALNGGLKPVLLLSGQTSHAEAEAWTKHQAQPGEPMRICADLAVAADVILSAT